MDFYQEPPHYQKTILSDLQGAWIVLRESVLQEHKTKDCSRLLFHIDEAMSWESVRNLAHMKATLVLIQSIAQQIGVSNDTGELIENIREILYEVLDEINAGKIP